MNDTAPMVINNNQLQDYSLEAYANNLKTKLELCTMIVKSGMAPVAFKTPESVLAVMLMGQEYGFSPMKSLDLFDHIQGRAALRAAGKVAKAVQFGGTFKTLVDTAEVCKVHAVRRNSRGDVIWEGTMEYSIKDAQVAGLLAKDNWKKHPKDMMYARVSGRLANRGWPEILGGLPSAEEILDGDAIDVTPKVTVVATAVNSTEAVVDPSVNSRATASLGDDDAPGSKEEESPQPEQKFRYNLNNLEQYMLDETYRKRVSPALLKYGKEVETNVWEVTKEFPAFASVLVQPEQAAEGSAE